MPSPNPFYGMQNEPWAKFCGPLWSDIDDEYDEDLYFDFCASMAKESDNSENKVISSEKDIDFVKALKIKEARLARRLREVRKTKDQLRKRITKRI